MHLPRCTPALDWNRHQRFAPSALRSSWPRAQATRKRFGSGVHPKTAQLWVPPQHDSPVAIAFHILSYFPYFSIPAAIKRYTITTRSILHHLLRVRWSHDGIFFCCWNEGFLQRSIDSWWWLISDRIIPIQKPLMVQHDVDLWWLMTVSNCKQTNVGMIMPITFSNKS